MGWKTWSRRRRRRRHRRLWQDAQSEIFESFFAIRSSCWKRFQDLRVLLDSILSIDQDLVTDAVRTLALNTITAYQSGVAIKWNDAELGIYLVYIFGEINKSKCSMNPISIQMRCWLVIKKLAGGKGRAAFCQAPAVDKDKRKASDYSEYPLTAHGEMLFALVQSGIASFPNRTVALQHFETVSRYTDFFKVRKECIIPTLEAMVDARWLSSYLWCTQLLTPGQRST